MMTNLIWLAPLLPLLAAALIAIRIAAGRVHGDDAERPTRFLSLAATSGSLLLLLALDVLALRGAVAPVVQLGSWFSSGAVNVTISFMLDTLALSMSTGVALLALLVLRFSATYLHREIGFHRFFLAMNLFTAGMLLIVLGGTAVLVFCGWELAGFSSYLLIGYAYDRQTATRNALRAFVTNRIGDAGFVLGIGLAYLLLGSAEWSALPAASTHGTLAAGVLALGFVLAAAIKSAQVPFSPWIAGALEGPTPSSAVFYGSLLVHAGVYLLLRLEPLLVQAPALMVLLAVMGLLTAVYGFLVGLVQTDVKSSLVHSTIAQVGLMFLACGLGWFSIAAWHLALHAVWRLYQFLSAPSYLQLTPRPAPAAPAWLDSRLRLYTMALQRFWLEPSADWLIVRPAQSFARDVRDLDERVISRLVGLPEEARAAVPRHARGDDILLARGAAGGLLGWIAEHLFRFEQRLVLQQSGALKHRLREVARLLLAVETLLEQPRYLLVMMFITLAAIL